MIPHGVEVFVGLDPIDLRWGFDRLSGVIADWLTRDARSGALFYLRDLFRALPHWPSGRFLELCPRDWLATRVRLDAVELKRELGSLAIPPPPAEQSASR